MHWLLPVTKMGSCGEVLMVPMGMSGHVNPMLYLAQGLLKRGITITMILEEEKKSLVKPKDIVEGFNVHLVKSAGGGGPGRGGFGGHGQGPGRGRGGPGRGEGGRGRSRGGLETGSEAFLQTLLAEQQSGVLALKCIIADQFTAGWTESWGDKLKIPRFVAIASPATFAYTMYHQTDLVEHGLLDDVDADPVIDLPGIPVLHLSDLTRASLMTQSMLTVNGDTFGTAAGLLFNTFYELEKSVIDEFEAQVNAASSNGQGPKMLPVGPMLPEEFLSEDTFQEAAQDSDCIQWLNNRPESSVIYIAFGSSAYLSPPQILELAHALEASQVSFLWILRVQTHGDEKVDISTLLPPGFEERTKDRGFIYTEFAPQLQILSHPATGAFMTHCGWNSSLESICRGVPMLGWPMGAEQKLCCRVLVDEAKVALELDVGPLGREKKLVQKDDIEKSLRKLLIEPEGQKLRETVKKLQQAARAARAPGGSSYKNFECLVNVIKGSEKILQAQ